MGVFRRLQLLVGGVIVLGAAGVSGWAWLSTQANVVFVDNTLPHAVEVRLNGEPRGTLGSGEAFRIELAAGEYELDAIGPAGDVTRGRFRVPDATGFRALYDLGGKGSYVVVRARYDSGGGGTDYQNIAPGSFVVLPADVSSEGIDSPFPATVNTSGSNATLTHLCRFDPSTERVGCPGA